MVSKTTKLNSGQEMPIVGLGTWKSKPGEVVAAVKYALQIGYRHLDCAFVYGNENEVGQGIKEAMEEYKIDRKDIWITSKLWSSCHHPEEIENACKTSLKNLGLEYLDLYSVSSSLVLIFKEGSSWVLVELDVVGICSEFGSILSDS